MKLLFLLISVIILIIGLFVQSKLSMKGAKWYYLGKIITIVGVILCVLCIVWAI